MGKRLFWLSDLHVGVRASHPVFLMEFAEVVDQVIEDMDDGDVVVLGGDLFDSRVSIHVRAMNAAKDALKKLTDKASEVYVMLGNHDIHFVNTLRPNSIEPLLEYVPRLKVIYTPTAIKHGQKNILLVPWIVPSALPDVEKALKTTNCTYCFGHFDIQGFKFNSRVTNENHGFKPSVFKKFERVVSGHYHVESQEGNIWYPGAQMQFTWDDEGLQKQYLVMDERGNIEAKPCGRPIFFKVHMGKEEDHPSPLNSFIKLIVNGDFSQKQIQAEVKRLTDAGAADVKVYQTFEASLKVDNQEVVQMLEQATDLREVIKSVGAEVEADTPEEQGAIVELFNEIIEEAFELEGEK